MKAASPQRRSPRMQNCPDCDSVNVHRSRVRSRWEALRRALTGSRPYRCHACGLRLWASDLGPGPGEFRSDAASSSAIEHETGGARRDRDRSSDFKLDDIDLRVATPDQFRG